MNPTTLPARHFTNVYTIRTELGLTQKELATHANVSPQLLLRAEQGLHPHLSGSIARALSELANIPESIIRREYRASREHNIKLFSIDLTESHDYEHVCKQAIIYAINNGGIPVRRFREFLFTHYGLPSSAIKFCTYTGLHSAVLSAVENGKVTWSECKALHRVLRNVLALSDHEISLLGKYHDDFYLRAHHD